MEFLRRISGLTWVLKFRSANICDSPHFYLLLLRLEKSQLRWYGHVTRTSKERTAQKMLWLTPVGQSLQDIPDLDGKIMLKIFFGLVLLLFSSIYPLSRRLEMLGDSSLSSCPPDLPRIREFRKVSKFV